MMDSSRVLVPSQDVVAREIEGEFIIVPIVAGIAKSDDELYTLNEFGLAIWKKLDGKKTLQDIQHELEEEYDASPSEIENDLNGFTLELLSRKLLMDV